MKNLHDLTLRISFSFFSNNLTLFFDNSSSIWDVCLAGRATSTTFLVLGIDRTVRTAIFLTVSCAAWLSLTSSHVRQGCAICLFTRFFLYFLFFFSINIDELRSLVSSFPSRSDDESGRVPGNTFLGFANQSIKNSCRQVTSTRASLPVFSV